MPYTSGDHERGLLVPLCHCLTPPASQRTKLGHKWGGGVSYLVIIKYMTPCHTPTLTDFIYRSSIYLSFYVKMINKLCYPSYVQKTQCAPICSNYHSLFSQVLSRLSLTILLSRWYLLSTGWKVKWHLTGFSDLESKIWWVLDGKSNDIWQGSLILGQSDLECAPICSNYHFLSVKCSQDCPCHMSFDPHRTLSNVIWLSIQYSSNTSSYLRWETRTGPRPGPRIQDWKSLGSLGQTWDQTKSSLSNLLQSTQFFPSTVAFSTFKLSFWTLRTFSEQVLEHSKGSLKTYQFYHTFLHERKNAKSLSIHQLD